jgi:hypothetical protein
MILKMMRNKNVECLFIKDIQKFMIFDWKNVLNHDIRFTMLLEMLFYVFQNDEEQIYVLFLIHHIERWCFYYRDAHHEQWFFLFWIKDSEFIKIESEIFNCFRIFNFINRFCRFFAFSKKLIADWSELNSFRKRSLMTIVRNFLEFLIESSNFEWFDWFKKDFFSKKMFFSLFDDDVVFFFIFFEWVQNSEKNSMMFVFSW